MSLLDTWTHGSHTVDAITHDTYRKGEGPGVVLIHEAPGLTPAVIGLGEEIVDRGYTVLMPNLFGEAEAPMSLGAVAKVLPRVCMNSEFTKIALNRTSPVATWLRSVARELHEDVGGPGVGALGMCFTGGYALAMMVDDSVAAPVVAQPSTPFPLGKARAADVNLSPEDLRIVKRRAAGGCRVLGLRYRDDGITGTRFDTLGAELGDNFIAVEFEGKGHGTLTEQRQQEAVDRVFDFFDERLRG